LQQDRAFSGENISLLEQDTQERQMEEQERQQEEMKVELNSTEQEH
jgi:hypothetical protein